MNPHSGGGGGATLTSYQVHPACDLSLHLDLTPSRAAGSLIMSNCKWSADREQDGASALLTASGTGSSCDGSPRAGKCPDESDRRQTSSRSHGTHSSDSSNWHTPNRTHLLEFAEIQPLIPILNPIKYPLDIVGRLQSAGGLNESTNGILAHGSNRGVLSGSEKCAYFTGT